MSANSVIDVGGEPKQPVDSTPPVSLGRYTYWIVALAVIVLALLYVRRPGSLGFPLDDGYISLHSAQVLHWGKDPNFANVPALAGITNAPYILLLYLLVFFLSPLNALLAASWLGILCYALGLAALGRAFRLPLVATLALVTLGLTAGKAAYQLLNGVETGTAMGIMVWIFALARSNTARSRKLAALLCGIGPYVRPELIALSFLVMAAMFWQDWQERKNIVQAARIFAPLPLLTILGALPWLLWYAVTTGHVIPQTIEAKHVFYADACNPSVYRWVVTWGGARFFFIVIGFLTLALAFLLRNYLGRCVLIFVPLFFFAYYERLPVALLHGWGRYTYILLPIVILGLAVGLGDGSVLVRRTAYVLLVLSCLQTAISFPDHWQVFLQDRDGFTHSLVSVADWANFHLPPNSTLLIHDAGYISYATKFQLVDFVGLKTPSSIAYNREITYPTCGIGRAAAVSEIARKAHPGYLIILDDWERSLRLTSGLRKLGWGLEEISPPGNYHVFRLTPPKQ